MALTAVGFRSGDTSQEAGDHTRAPGLAAGTQGVVTLRCDLKIEPVISANDRCSTEDKEIWSPCWRDKAVTEMLGGEIEALCCSC